MINMTTLEFAKAITDKTIEQKNSSRDSIKMALKANKNPDGSEMTQAQKNALCQLYNWLGVNIAVGTELCPPANLTTFNKEVDFL